MTQPNLQQNVDLQEVQKFTDLANEWWDKSGAFATLHQINPLRLNWIEQQTIARQQSGLTGKKVLDVGCGGGILSHSMAVRGATVTGIDLGMTGTEEVYFATSHYGAIGGIEVTASHNPINYNGLKLVPAVVVDGKYVVEGEDGKVPQVVNYLINKARAERGGK